MALRYVLTAFTTLLLLICAACSGSGGLDTGSAPALEPGLQSDLDGLAAPEGVDPELFEQLKTELARQLATVDKTASAPPLDDDSASKVTFDDGSGTLTWYYRNTGDYDQNGEVNVADLTPIALNFGNTGPIMDDQSVSVVDGDGNGEINLGDITPIAVNFQTTVNSYAVYSSPTEDDIPDTPGGPVGAGAVSLGTVSLGDALGDTATDRLYFEFTVPAPNPGDFYWVRPVHGTDEGIPTPRIFETGSGSPDGGTIELHDVVIDIPEGALLDPVDFTHHEIEVPAGLPSMFVDTGVAHEITVSDPDMLDAPVVITLPYDDRGLESEEFVVALHVNGAGEYEPLTLLRHDPVANTVTFDTRDFSAFTVAALNALELAQGVLALDSYTINDGWSSSVDGWNINNFGSYFSPGGNCLGMSGYAVWWYKNKPAEILYGKYSTAGGAPTSIAHITATRAHLAQNQFWAFQQWNEENTLGARATGILMKAFLKAFDHPLILLLGQGASGRHACVVYGWDATGFKFYEVNQVDSDMHVNWSEAGGWGNYGAYNNFGFVALPSLGRGEDFAQLAAEAEAGFTGSQDINLTSPEADADIDSHDANLAGTMGGGLNGLAELIVYVKGVSQTVPVNGGVFNSTIPITNGENTIILIAGAGGQAKQSTWFRNGATLIRNVNGLKDEADLIATLSWDQDQSDVDLYVTEPTGATSWYGGKVTVNGLELDFDNTSGFGPEHTTLSTADGDTVEPGEYVVRVHYYADHGLGGAVSGRVSIVANEGKPNFQLMTVPFTIGSASSSTAGPGGAGPEWRDIARIKLIDDTP